MTEYLEKYKNGEVAEYKPTETPISLGVDYLPTVYAPAEDRNRTSPFPVVVYVIFTHRSGDQI
jgi:glutamine synthetase type III